MEKAIKELDLALDKEIKFIIDITDDEKIKKKGKKHIRKPKMPARIKKNQTHKRKR